MKRLIALFLPACMLVALCACGAQSGEVSQQQEQQQEQQQQQQEQVQRPEQQEQVQDFPEDRFTEVERNAAGGVIRTLEGERGNGGTERFYDDAGVLQKESVEFADGVKEERTFRSDGSLEWQSITDPQGVVVQMQLDETGRRVSETIENPDGYRETRSFDENDRLISASADHPDGAHTELTFHENDRIYTEVTTAPDGSVVEREYDPEGQLVRDIWISPDGEVEDRLNFQPEPEPDQGGTGEPQPSQRPQGTQVGSVTRDGEYTVVTLGQDNWQDYLEEYVKVAFVPQRGFAIVETYFVVKSGVGEVDLEKSDVKLQYIAEQRSYECTLDVSREVFTYGEAIRKGGTMLSDPEYGALSGMMLDGETVSYGLSCSMCQLDDGATDFGYPTIIGLQWVTGSLYLK